MSQKTTFATINQLQSPSLVHTEELEQRVQSGAVLLQLWAHLEQTSTGQAPHGFLPAYDNQGRRSKGAQNDCSGVASPGLQGGVNQHSPTELAAVALIHTGENPIRQFQTRRSSVTPHRWSTQVHVTQMLLFIQGKNKESGNCPEFWGSGPEINTRKWLRSYRN